MQMLVVAFEGNRFKGEILPELERLKYEGIVRVIDLLVVRKDSSGAVATLTASDLDWEEAVEFGGYIGGLVGFGAAGREGMARGQMAGEAELADGHLFTADDAFHLTAAVPDGMSVGVLLLEHRWALPLRGAIDRAGGFEVSNEWIGADELVTFGRRQAAGERPDDE